MRLKDNWQFFNNNYNIIIQEFYKVPFPPEGILRFELDRGVPLDPQNPYTSLRVILAEKGTHF